MKNIKLLMDCGFNLYESKILLSLAWLGPSTAKEIGKEADVPKNKVYEILENFREKEIIQLVPTKPKRYNVINLKQILKKRVTEKKEKLDDIEKNVEKILDNLPKTNNFEETFWIMEGVNAMVNKILEKLDTIENESIAFVDLWVAKPENLRAVKKCIKRGVNFYFLGTIDKKTKPIAREFAKIGVNIRHYPVKGAGYSIFDKKYVQLRVTEKKVLTLWVESPHFGQMLRQHFFDLWKQARPVSF